jgi:hypothetical protein
LLPALQVVRAAMFVLAVGSWSVRGTCGCIHESLFCEMPVPVSTKDPCGLAPPISRGFRAGCPHLLILVEGRVCCRSGCSCGHECLHLHWVAPVPFGRRRIAAFVHGGDDGCGRRGGSVCLGYGCSSRATASGGEDDVFWDSSPRSSAKGKDGLYTGLDSNQHNYATLDQHDRAAPAPVSPPEVWRVECQCVGGQ